MQRTPVPTAFTVNQNYPNPFASSSEFEIGLTQEATVAVDVFDVQGRRIVSLAPRRFGSGWQRLTLESRDHEGRALPAGVYFYRVRANGEEVVRKMLIMR